MVPKMHKAKEKYERLAFYLKKMYNKLDHVQTGASTKEQDAKNYQKAI